MANSGFYQVEWLILYKRRFSGICKSCLVYNSNLSSPDYSILYDDLKNTPFLFQTKNICNRFEKKEKLRVLTNVNVIL